MSTSNPTTVTNEDILRELRAWHTDILDGWSKLRENLASLEARIVALEDARL